MRTFSAISACCFFMILVLGLSSTTQAQFRKDQQRPSDLTGPIIKKEDPSEGANWSNLFNMRMDHSYSMSFSSVGGQTQNINAYTNTMHFFFSEDLTGRVDLQLLHSPFGNSFMGSQNSGSGIDFKIRNAELNYELSENSNISIQFQQVPSYGYGYGASPFSPPYTSSFGDQNF
ncbi:hypothetical protein LX73_1852 [Fodinibius salinus]|uniref:Uncharacterized protein n=1 Tax=Fodinibius salinus TaxID=860790 RepID=A0A5D3YN24_9BACT|nr:hypothetical protein [Fodinibius salinus]TYP94127.1 hypothetical protein LX73_1852 [Fodinibius salinus]